LPSHWIYYLWLAIITVSYLGIVIYKKNAAVLLLAWVAVLNILPLTGFPLDYFDTRYLYLSLTASAILLALIVNAAMSAFGARRLVGASAAVLIALLIFGNGTRVAESAARLAEYTRQVRVPFRDIASQHPEFPENTLLYFIHSPQTPLIDFQGLFLTRYGTELSVSGAEDSAPARLRDYAHAYVYYFDSTGKPIELPVDRRQIPQSTPMLPVRYEAPITLEGFQVASSQILRGKALVVILNWRASAKIDQDFTVFAHLVDENGSTISSLDSPPLGGKSPTSEWRPNILIADAIVLPVDSDTLIGQTYRLELGMYDPASGKRLSIVDANGQSIGDTVVVAPFTIEP
jgi:hypothetical protein